MQIVSTTREKVRGQTRLTVTFTPNKWQRFWGKPDVVREFRGSGTVWREHPSGIRPGIVMEGTLVTVNTHLQMQEEDESDKGVIMVRAVYGVPCLEMRTPGWQSVMTKEETTQLIESLNEAVDFLDSGDGIPGTEFREEVGV